MTTTSSSGEPDPATAAREIVIARAIGAPRELVFEAFTQVRHLSRWWGPEGFTTTTRSFEFRAGGAWDFVMHGPDGTDYQEWITWTEIVPPERIAMLHGESRDDPNAFESVLTFDPAGEETRIVMRTVFPTKELREEAVEKYHAIEGGEQTLRNLAAYVTEVARERSTGHGPATAGETMKQPSRRSEQMTRTRIHNLSISLDGFATGEGQAPDAPMGHAGQRLAEWMFATRFGAPILGRKGGTVGIDDAVAQQHEPGIGAEIMGAGKFGPPGWQDDADWKGWWGPNPPFHTPTFVLTHRPRSPIEMAGGTTFHFLDASPAEALDVAREAAAGQDVRIGGGPTVARDFIAAGLVDHVHLVQVPIVLGRGVRLWDGLEALEADYDIEAVSTPSGVTHLTFTRS